MSIDVNRLPDIHFYCNGIWDTLKLSKAGYKIRTLSRLIDKNFAKHCRLGLIYKTSTDLVLFWLAILDSGREPLILQYPTQKQGYDYWQSSISNIIEQVQLEGILCSKEVEDLTLLLQCNVVSFEDNIEEGYDCCEAIEKGYVIQLSSGTTGFRKAIRYSIDDFSTHVKSLNATLALQKESDVIVSWLPLYHDMGFVACFIMPLFLGIPVVMIDPMDWVQDKKIFYEAIDKFQGTICYMPNFGFEVMAKISFCDFKLDSMRYWISCSEPAYLATMQKFADATNIPRDTLSVCYAMAENVFAVTFKKGLTSQEDYKVLSCGKPINNVVVKLIDGEIFVKSDTSIKEYFGGSTIADANGFYPTGDMGKIINGELYVLGRKHDVMIQSGEKFILSDFDYIVNNVLGTEGRAACLSIYEPVLATQKLLILIERDDFWNKTEEKVAKEKLVGKLPVENFELEFVPIEYITKTSSGKINRVKTLADYEKMKLWKDEFKSSRTFETEVERYFSGYSFDVPVEKLFDSLGKVLFTVLCDEYGVEVTSDITLKEAIIKANISQKTELKEEEYIYIVASSWPASICLTEEDIEILTHKIGRKIKFEQVCLPPVEILLRDLEFCDYFLCRDYNDDYEYYWECIKKVKDASILLFIDDNEFSLRHCSFPVISKRFIRNEIADLFGVRYQKYARQHHKLPIENLLSIEEILSEDKEKTFQAIESYLDIPVFRVALELSNASRTANWEYKEYHGEGCSAINYEKRIVKVFATFLEKNINKVKMNKGKCFNYKPVISEMGHFCSFCVNPFFIELIINKHDSFIINGRGDNVPYLEKRLKQENKKYKYVSMLDENKSFSNIDVSEYDCIVQTGYGHALLVSMPVYQLIHTEGPAFPGSSFLEGRHLYINNEMTMQVFRKIGLGFVKNCKIEMLYKIGNDYPELLVGLAEILFQRGYIREGFDCLKKAKDSSIDKCLIVPIVFKGACYAASYGFVNVNDLVNIFKDLVMLVCKNNEVRSKLKYISTYFIRLVLAQNIGDKEYKKALECVLLLENIYRNFHCASQGAFLSNRFNKAQLLRILGFHDLAKKTYQEVFALKKHCPETFSNLVERFFAHMTMEYFIEENNRREMFLFWL